MSRGRAQRYCKNDDGMLVHAHGRCRTCDQYWRRNGRERPEELIVKTGLQQLERDMVRRRRMQFATNG